MTFTRNDADKITLEMSVDEWERLLLMAGYAAGAAMGNGERETFWRWIKLANEINRTNPNYIPYEIPAEFA